MNFFVTDKKMDELVEAKIQALTEGEKTTAEFEALLARKSTNESGLENPYTQYGSQTEAIYEKYNGRTDLGTWLVRTVIDTRTAFISGEGLSVVTDDEELSEFFDEILTENRLKGSRFHNMVKGSEMEGRQLLTVSYQQPKKDETEGKIKIVSKNSQYSGGENYKVYLTDEGDITDIDKVVVVNEFGDERTIKGDFVYVKIGGDPSKVNETPTRCGLVLKEIDNFSRAMNVMRANNHLFARVTPFFKTMTQKEATSLLKSIENTGWELGMAFAGAADMDLKVPSIGAMQNIQAELLALTKSISSVSGIPIHWFGYVDAMSNRSVAENLFEAINNATIQERSIWQESIYDILIKAQEIAIDNGLIRGEVKKNFEVKIPLISFSKSIELVKNLSLAYHDNVISRQDYMNHLPGIDPHKTEQFIQNDPYLNAKPNEVDHNNDPAVLATGAPNYLGPANGANNNNTSERVR